MTSVQADFSSAHPVDEIACLSDVQLSDLHGASSPAGRQDFEARLGGTFLADITVLLECQLLGSRVQPEELQGKPSSELTPRQFTLIRIQAGNVEGAIDFVQRHAPEQMDWLNTQLKFHKLQQSDTTTPAPFLHIRAVRQTVLIDAEAGRLAKVMGQFGVFRAWAYAHHIDDGDGRVERTKLEDIWRDTQIAQSKRHARRLLKEGIQHGYWTVDRRSQRVYLSG